MSFTVIQGNVNVHDPNGNSLSINQDGRLYVMRNNPPIPTGGVQAYDILENSVVGYNYERSEYTIPNKWRLYIQRCLGGCSNSLNRGSLSIVYYTSTGSIDGNEFVVSWLYSSGNNPERDCDIYYDGNGTAKIVNEIKRLDKGKRSVYSMWHGYRILLDHTEIDTGTTATTTSTTLTDISKSWTPDAFIGYYVTIGDGGCLIITDNDATSITFSGNTNTGTNKSYKIVDFT